MRGWLALAGISLLAVAHGAATGQDVGSVANEDGPPHESLGRAVEHLNAVLCGLPDRVQLQAEFNQKYDRRIKKVQSAVEQEFGQAAARRSFISLLPCYRYRSGQKADLAIENAVNHFEHELERWEARYKL